MTVRPCAEGQSAGTRQQARVDCAEQDDRKSRQSGGECPNSCRSADCRAIQRDDAHARYAGKSRRPQFAAARHLHQIASEMLRKVADLCARGDVVIDHEQDVRGL